MVSVTQLHLLPAVQVVLAEAQEEMRLHPQLEPPALVLPVKEIMEAQALEVLEEEQAIMPAVVVVLVALANKLHLEAQLAPVD
jgi:hypothetical protein